jgi:hypothetical protein
VLAVAALAAVPWALLAFNVADIYTNDQPVIYGAERPSGLFGWITRIADVAWEQTIGIEQFAGSYLWSVLFVAVPAAVVGFSVWRRRVLWAPAAMALLAWALLLFQGLTGVVQSRYYIPVVALIAVAGVLLVVELGPRLQALFLTGVVVLSLGHTWGAHRLVDSWVSAEEQNEAFVEGIAALSPSTCPTYRVGVDVEKEASVPIIVSLIGEPGTCPAGDFEAVMVHGHFEALDAGDEAAMGACRGDWQQIDRIAVATVLGCASVDPAQRGALEDRRVRVPADPVVH